MGKRIAAISFIFVCTTVAWAILAGSVFFRTWRQDDGLRESVVQLWGAKHIQQAPVIKLSPGDKILPMDSTDIKVKLELEHRKKGLLWYSTYRVHFSGTYQVANPSKSNEMMALHFVFPNKTAIYDNFEFQIDGQAIDQVALESGNIIKTMNVSPNQTKTIYVSYVSQGLDEWWYDFGQNVNQVKNFSLEMTTNFNNIDFPAESISPTHKEEQANGMKLTWHYENLLTGVKIGLAMPQKLNPGPWVGRVTTAAPVSLFLFFFLVFVLTTIRHVKFHPMNYFFLGAAYFSFHLLLSYLVDHISIHLAFWICSAVSVFLVVSYMRLVVGVRQAFIEIAVSQLIYLILFSYTFFFEGYTGLAITILCICTLFIVMQITGKIDWESVFAKDAHSPTATKLPPEAPKPPSFISPGQSDR